MRLLQCICPLLAQSGHGDSSAVCPLLGVKRTWLRDDAAPACDPSLARSLARWPSGEPPFKGNRAECNTSKGGKNESITSSLVLVGTNFHPVRMGGLVLWATA